MASFNNLPLTIEFVNIYGSTVVLQVKDSNGGYLNRGDFFAQFGSSDVQITLANGAVLDIPASDFATNHHKTGIAPYDEVDYTVVDPNHGTSSAWLTVTPGQTQSEAGTVGLVPQSFDLASSPSSWTYTFSADPQDGINKAELKIQDSNGVEMSKADVDTLVAADSSADSLHVVLSDPGSGGTVELFLIGSAADPSTILYQPEAGSGPSAGFNGTVISATPAVAPAAGSPQAFDTLTSAGDNASSNAASVTPLDDNSEDGIVGHLHDLLENDICDAFANDIAPEQQMLDDMISLINVDNGADAQFAEDITDAMESYIEAAHPALVQSMLGMIEMLHNSNEELVEWSFLKHMRDLVEARRAALDTCLDDQKSLGLDKVLNRLFAQVGASVTVTEADLVASPPTGGVTEGDGTNGFAVGEYFVDVNHPDGSGGYIAAKIPVTSMRKALLNLSNKRTVAETAFNDARDAAAVNWSEDFKNEFLFEYDSLRTANAQDASFDNTITIGDQLGQSAVYAIASDTSDDVASAEAEYDTAGSTDDDYPTGAKSVMARDA